VFRRKTPRHAIRHHHRGLRDYPFRAWTRWLRTRCHTRDRRPWSQRDCGTTIRRNNPL